MKIKTSYSLYFKKYIRSEEDLKIEKQIGDGAMNNRVVTDYWMTISKEDYDALKATGKVKCLEEVHTVLSENRGKNSIYSIVQLVFSYTACIDFGMHNEFGMHYENY